MPKQVWVDKGTARLAHNKAVRDALIACGNKRPSMPDPPGGYVIVVPKLFDGPVFFNHLKSHLHSAAEFELCRCFN